MAIIKQYHKDTDTTYVFESQSYWVPELGQSRSKRKLLGKLDPVTGEIVPCGKRGRKKKDPENGEEQVSAGEFTKLQGLYEQSQKEVTQLRLSLSETEKELNELRKRNQQMENTIRQIRSLVGK